MAEIKLLKEFPNYAPILAYWSYLEWYRNRDIGLEVVIKAYQARTDDKDLPISWIAIEDDIPVGMVSLKNDDLWSRKDLNPWLASLYVTPDYRERGVADLLIKTVIKKTINLNIDLLYLFVSKNEWTQLDRFYTKRGWEFLENAKGNDSEEVRIYTYSIKI